MSRLRVAVVGCGEAAQILHLPSLRFLDDLFAVTVVCDVSAAVAARVARDWNVPHATDHRDAVRRDDVDVVLVTTPDALHTPVVLDAVAAGKHVLVEKPLCITLREAGAVVEAQRAAGVVVQVGYMRRYAPAFLEAKRAIASLGPVRLARAQHVLGLNELIVSQVARVAKDAGVDTAAARDLRSRLLAEATDDAPPIVQDAYALLLSLASHDLSAMRELLGEPRRVLYGATWRDAWYVAGAFDFGGFVCDFAAGFDRIPRVASFFEAHCDDGVVRIDFESSFVKNLPSRVRVVVPTGNGGVEERTLQPTWSDPFVEEWRAFHDHVSAGTQPKASPEDFRRDLALFGELATAIRRSLDDDQPPS